MPIYRNKARSCYEFHFDRYVGGKRIRARKRLPETWNRSQAEAFDRAESDRLRNLVPENHQQRWLIADAVLVYLEERIPQLKSGINVTRELAQMYWAYEGKKLSELSEVCKNFSATVTRDSAANNQPLAPATIKNRIRQLVAACRYGWKHHNMGECDPGTRVIVPQVRNERQEYVNRLQMLQLSRGCTNRHARLAVRIAFYSGMRLGEILRAKMSGGRFMLADTKNGDPRIIPVHPRILVCVRKLNQSTPKITIQRSFTVSRTKAGLSHIHFHDLRHTAASELINAGVDLYTIGRILGHKDPRSTQRYAHLETATLAIAINKIGARQSPMVKKSPPPKKKAP